MEKDRETKNRGSYYKEKCKPYFNMIQQYAEELANETDNALKTKKVLAFIEFQKSFWHYSLNNQILIKMQYPKAKMVKGFKQWKKLGRHVKKGEKAITILAPRTYLKTDYENVLITYANTGHIQNQKIKVYRDDKVTGFVPVNVFDLNQTKGKPLPETPEHRTHTNTRPDLLKKLETLIKTKGINLVYANNLHGANGMTDGRSIYILDSLSLDDKFQTGIHEYLHYIKHFDKENNNISKDQKELEAEATSYIVSKILGLETKSYNYIAVCHGDGKAVLQSLTRISKAIRTILQELNNITIEKEQMVIARTP